MAISRREFLNKLEDYHDIFMERFFLIGAYPDSPDVNHWINELVTFCLIFDGVKVKSNEPTSNDYLTFLLTKVDTISDVKFFTGVNDGKPIQFKNDDDCERFIKIWKDLRIDLANSFSSEVNNTKSYYSDLIKQLI